MPSGVVSSAPQRGMSKKHPLDLVGERAFLPVILFAEDLALAFRISRSAAQRRLRHGAFGPCFRSGRRWAVLREDLLAHLHEQVEEAGHAPEGERTNPPDWARDVLERKGRP